jgi:hypothetical protein
LPWQAGITADPGVVHQYANRSESLSDGFAQLNEIVRIGNVSRDGQHVGCAVSTVQSDGGGGALQGIAIEIGQNHLHSQSRETHCSRKTDTARSSSYNRRLARGKCVRQRIGHVVKLL